MVKENKLHTAVKSNNLSNVLKVLEKYNKQKCRTASTKSKKLDLDLRDNHGLTVTHHAARNGSLEILEAVLAHECKFDIFDLHGLRPISYACAEGHIKIVDFLLRWGSSANRLNSFEYLTPLHLAAMYGYAEIVHLLLQYKADPFAINRENKTPLDLACAYGKYNVINLLISFTKSLTVAKKQVSGSTVTASADNYGSRTPHTDQMSRYNRVSQCAALPSTPKVSHRSSSPYGSGCTTTSSGGASNYSSDNSSKQHRFHRNISFGDSSCSGSPVCQNTARYPAAHTQALHAHNSAQQQSIELATAAPDASSPHSSGDACCCPSLDVGTVAESPNDLRQNLREACFAVQARAVLPFKLERDGVKGGISFEIGTLITVLKQYHNGVVKGFVTAEGINNTSLFPVNYIEYINEHKPPTCCNRPLDRKFLQSPEKTPVASRGKSVKERPTYLELQGSNPKSGSAGNADNEAECGRDQESGSPILIPPQMSEIRTSTSNSAAKWCSSAMPRCGCDGHLGQLCGTGKLVSGGPNHQSPESPSVSSSDLSYYLSLGPAFMATVTGSANKRNSVASMDSGRGSATDSKSVVSGSTPASASCNKAPTSPIYYCPSKSSASNPGPSGAGCGGPCRCRECMTLPTTVPTPFHQHHMDDNSSGPHQHHHQAAFYQVGLDGEFGGGPGGGLATRAGGPYLHQQAQQQQQMQPPHGTVSSVDSVYYQCSMMSLDDTTQYSGTGSDRGVGSVDDIMINWLYFIGLGGYADVLSGAGYDLATLSKATPEDLNASGVTNPTDRQLMKTNLNRLSVCDGLPDTMPGTIHEFLDNLKLLQYEDLLAKQNFTKIDHLMGLTWEDLADIGVEKLGHQKKLSLAIERLSRLAMGQNHQQYRVTQCHSSCTPAHPPSLDMIRGGHSPYKYSLSTVSQSRSFEELPYPTAVMDEADHSLNDALLPRRHDLHNDHHDHHDHQYHHHMNHNYRVHRNCTYQSLRLSGGGFVAGSGNGSSSITAGGAKKTSILSKSDESVSSVTEISCPPRAHLRMFGRPENRSVSSSASSCSQESSKDDSCASSQSRHLSSAAHFAHDNIGTVRIKRPTLASQVDGDDIS